jgi:hypothetical protein
LIVLVVVVVLAPPARNAIDDEDDDDNDTVRRGSLGLRPSEQKKILRANYLDIKIMHARS